jgi:hypothetical protein
MQPSRRVLAWHAGLRPWVGPPAPPEMRKKEKLRFGSGYLTEGSEVTCPKKNKAKQSRKL